MLALKQKLCSIGTNPSPLFQLTSQVSQGVHIQQWQGGFVSLACWPAFPKDKLWTQSLHPHVHTRSYSHGRREEWLHHAIEVQALVCFKIHLPFVYCSAHIAKVQIVLSILDYINLLVFFKLPIYKSISVYTDSASNTWMPTSLKLVKETWCIWSLSAVSYSTQVSPSLNTLYPQKTQTHHHKCLFDG